MQQAMRLRMALQKERYFSGITVIQTECARQIVRSMDHLIPNASFKLLSGKTLQGGS